MPGVGVRIFKSQREVSPLMVIIQDIPMFWVAVRTRNTLSSIQPILHFARRDYLLMNQENGFNHTADSGNSYIGRRRFDRIVHIYYLGKFKLVQEAYPSTYVKMGS